MAMIYKSLTDVLNRARWNVVVPDGLMVKIPYYYQKYPERMPIHNPDNTTRAMGQYTISNIVTFCVDGVVFSIPNPGDHISVCKYLSAYIEETHIYIAELPETDNAVIFFNKCKRALAILNELGDHALMVEKKSQIKPPSSLSDILKLI